MKKNLNLENDKNLEERYAEALNSDDVTAFAKVMVEAHNEVLEQLDELRAQNVDVNDSRAMEQLGYPVLTAEEREYYNQAISANTFDGITALLPITTMERVFHSIEEEFPILKAVGIKNTTYLTKFPFLKAGADTAVWGAYTDEIKGQLDFSFEIVDVTMGKLTCYMVVPQDLFEVKAGIHMLDQYVVSYMTKAMGRALEKGILTGTGHGGQIIGFNRDLEKPKVTDYAEKDAVELKDLKPATLGAKIMAPLTKNNETGEILLVVNPADYWSKVFGLVTYQMPNGEYVTNKLPIPARFETSPYIASNRMLAIRPNHYFLGSSRSSKIEKSDEYKFIEDWKTYKAKGLFGGKPEDNNQSVLFDITALGAPSA